MKPTVYLAGPIAGLTYEGATDWRDAAAAALCPEIACFSPMRGKDYFQGTGVIDTRQYIMPLSTDRGIVARDRFDVQRCDLVLANLAGAPYASIGSCVEFGWADAFRKPIVAVIDGGAHDHPFLRQLAGWVVPTLDEAYAIVRVILLP